MFLNQIPNNISLTTELELLIKKINMLTNKLLTLSQPLSGIKKNKDLELSTK